MKRMKANVYRDENHVHVRCSLCPATFTGRSARPGCKGDHQRLERKAKAAGWTFPRVARGGPVTRRTEPLCPACANAVGHPQERGGFDAR